MSDRPLVFFPAGGDRFEIITFEEATNLDKLNITGGNLGSGLELVPEISPNILTLVVVNTDLISQTIAGTEMMII